MTEVTELPKPLEDIIRVFKERLFLAFDDFLEINKDKIGTWHDQLSKASVDAKDKCDTGMDLIGDSMWMLNMIAQLGVGAGIQPNSYSLQYLHNGLDEKSTKRLLGLMAATLALQGLPVDMLKAPIRVISSKKFSLSLYVERYGP